MCAFNVLAAGGWRSCGAEFHGASLQCRRVIALVAGWRLWRWWWWVSNRVFLEMIYKFSCHTTIVLTFPGWMHTLAERLRIPVANITHMDAYVTSLYYTFTSLTSVGFGNVSANTTAEKVFSIVMMLIGGMVRMYY